MFGLDSLHIRRIIADTLTRVGILEPVALSVLITNDENLRRLNREYRGLDEATDVLSFPLLDTPLAQADPDELWQPADPETSSMEYMDPQTPELYPGDDSFGPDDEMEVSADFEEPESAFEFPVLEASSRNLGDIAISRDAVERQSAAAGHSAAWEFAFLVAHGVLHLVGYDDQTDAGYRAMVAHQESVLMESGVRRDR